jgi:signal-transduction protein with cAMP-binding, CBS, and nucleotidyltransferase domain
MRIGVTTCKPEDSIEAVAAQMIDGNCTAVVVLDEDGDSRGWINEQRIANAFLRREAAGEDSPALTAADVMDEDVPDGPADIPLTAAIQLMADRGVDHLFFLHHAGGRAWPASLLSLRDVVRAVAGPDYIQGQGVGAPRPTPMDLFRQRYPRAKGQS